MAARKHPQAHFFNAVLLVVCTILSGGCAPEMPEITGTAYYLDCVRGNDANPGSASQPWKSPEKVNALFVNAKLVVVKLFYKGGSHE
jgi:hypothetical protein